MNPDANSRRVLYEKHSLCVGIFEVVTHLLEYNKVIFLDERVYYKYDDKIIFYYNPLKNIYLDKLIGDIIIEYAKKSHIPLWDGLKCLLKFGILQWLNIEVNDFYNSNIDEGHINIEEWKIEYLDRIIG
jgi:hypothetical protein